MKASAANLLGCSTDMINLMLQYAVDVGLDKDVIAKVAGIDAADLADRERRLDHGICNVVWREIDERTGDPDFGLHFGESFEQLPAGGHLLGSLMMNSPTVGEALERFFLYHGLISDAVRLELEKDGGEALVRLDPVCPDAIVETGRHLTEFILALIRSILICIGDGNPQLIQVRFSHEKPESTKEHERIFGCPLLFSQPVDELVIGGAELSRRILLADPELLRTVERLAKERLSRLASAPDWSDPVRRGIVEKLLGGNKPSIETLAKKMAVSPRTLQTKLKEEGTTYQEILDVVRRELAQDYLKNGDLELFDIAFLLGYADQSAFNHAFKRWVGLTPREFRKELLA